MEREIFYRNWLHLTEKDIEKIYKKFRRNKDIYICFKNVFGIDQFKKYVFFIEGIQLKNYSNKFIHYLCLDYLRKPRLKKFINIFTRYSPYDIPSNGDPYVRERRPPHRREKLKERIDENKFIYNLIRPSISQRYRRIGKISIMTISMHKKFTEIEEIISFEEKDTEKLISEKVNDILKWFYNFPEIHPNAAIKERLFYADPEVGKNFFHYNNLRKIWINIWNLDQSKEIPQHLKNYFMSDIQSGINKKHIE